MIIGIGTDIVEIERVLKACENERFMEKCYTEEEQQLVRQRKSRAASNFAAKEAVSKVLGTGFRGFTPRDVEVLRDEFGCPYVILHNGALDISNKLGIQRILVTLSDTKDCAVAYAIGEGAAK